MSKSSVNQFGYSENQMADSFVELLQSFAGLPGIGSFDSVYREVKCRQGQPDFIALRNRDSRKKVPVLKLKGIVGPSILSLLKPKSARTLNFLVLNSVYSENSVKRSLSQLLAAGYVEKTKTGSYILGKIVLELNTEVWSFELKLNNPKRAVFQAKQSRAFADRSIIIIPPGQERNYKRYSETMKRWGIGLATFEPLKKEFRIVRRGRKSRAFSKQHQIYAMTQLTS